MKKVRQTRGGQPGGNCFQAAAASLFHLDLEDVPDFMNDVGNPDDPEDASWLEAFIEWVRWFGLEVSPVPWEYVEAFGLKPTGLVTGLTDGGGSDHTVVVVEGEFWHDPAGVGMIEEPLIVYTLTPDPTRLEGLIGGPLFMKGSPPPHGEVTEDSLSTP